MLARLSAASENTPLVAKGNITDNLKVIMEYRREVKQLVTRIRDIFEGMETVKSVGATAAPSGMDVVEEAEYARVSIDEEGNVIVD